MMPRDVMRVVFLMGTDYEIGYQYGACLADSIAGACTDAWVRALRRGDPRHPSAASREAVSQDLAVYRDLLARHSPGQLDQVQGMVDALKHQGKSISESDILLIQAGVNRRLAAESQSIRSQLDEKSCCSWSAWGSTTTGGQLICSDSFDGDYKDQACLIVFPNDGSPYVSTVSVGELSSHFGYSFSGLFFGNSGGNGRRLVDWGYGLRWTSLVQHCVRYAQSAEEARELIEAWPHAIPENYHLVDRNRNALVVELTADAMSIRRPGDCREENFLYSTNNFMSQEMRVACDPHEEADYVPHGGWPGNAGVPRNLEIYSMLSRYAGHVDLGFAKMMWRFPGDSTSGVPEHGWSNMICRLNNIRVAVVLPDEGEFGEIHICTGPVGRIIKQFRRSTFPIDGTHTFVRIPLRASPEEMVEEMYAVARDEVALAYHHIAQLSAINAGYAGLSEAYARAHGALYMGRDTYYEGLLAGPSDQLRLLSSAASEFALAQARSSEVRELIDPPPCCPDQLGLEPWESELTAPPEYGPGFAADGRPTCL